MKFYLEAVLLYQEINKLLQFLKKPVLNGFERLCMKLMRTPPFFTKQLKTSEKNIERWLGQLKKEGEVEFRGAPKTGGYYFIQKD